MVGRESKNGSVFSWADEVEKEEQAAAARGSQAQVEQKQKPNPFGSARPREVVLQEKGIDWRKLDLHLQPPFPSRHESQNEKLQKQNDPQTTTTMLNSKQPNPAPSRCLKQNLQDSKVRLRGSPVSSQVILVPQIQSPILLVPPLRYPPKFVAGVLYEPGVSNSLNALDSGYQHFKHELENRFHEEIEPHNLKSEFALCGNRRRTTTGLVQPKEAQQKARILGESVVYGNKPEADSATRKEKFNGWNSLGLPLVNLNIGPPEPQDKRMPVNARQPRNIGPPILGRDGTAFQASENSKAMEDKWQKINRKVPDLSVKQVNNGGRDTAPPKSKGDRAGLGRNNKKNFEKKQIKVKNLELKQCAY